ncbi:MBL fold metallo-hydrolase [Paragemmobacter ruber]|uniref:Zn-dependent hydrolase n=1 Tax=Paragemmobacter ruber TaxID=1985673 RepID=A0ABW9Y106_9RHOB|nr:MBL fold metallo-hydrolase [Rhodobacter ruber]NBE06159.1 Zn-dependent hydrolase [Rhodobacter ruber]
MPRLARVIAAACLALLPLTAPVQAAGSCSAVSRLDGMDRLWHAQLAPQPAPNLPEPPRLFPRSPDPGPINPGEVRLHFSGHGGVVIIASDGTIAATDYNDIPGITTLVPDVITMNDTLPTQKTDTPDARIPHILQGWPDAQGRPAAHDLHVGGMLVRNVTTNTRGTAGQGMRVGGNSIFIFETEGLCVAHFGLLQVMPNADQLARIGRLDVAIIAVEGPNLLPTDQMIALLRHLQVRVVIPVHWNTYETLAQVMAQFEREFPVVLTSSPQIDLSAAILPGEMTVMVLTPRYFPF